MNLPLRKMVNRTVATTLAAAHPVLANRDPMRQAGINSRETDPNRQIGDRLNPNSARRQGVETHLRDRSSGVNDRLNPQPGEGTFQSPYLRRFEDTGLFHQQAESAERTVQDRERHQGSSSPETESTTPSGTGDSSRTEEHASAPETSAQQAEVQSPHQNEMEGTASPISPDSEPVINSGSGGETSRIQLMPTERSSQADSTHDLRQQETGENKGEAQTEPSSGSLATSVGDFLRTLVPAPSPQGPVNPVQLATIREYAGVRNDSEQTEAQVNEEASSRKRASRALVATSMGTITSRLMDAQSGSLNALEAGRNSLQEACTMLLSMVSTGVGNLFSTAQSLLNGLRISILTLAINISATVQTTVMGIVNQVTGILGSIPLPDLPGMDTLRNLIQGALFGAVKVLLRGLSTSLALIQRIISNVLRMIRNFLNRLYLLITQLLARVLGMVTRILTTLNNLIARIIVNLISTVSTVLATLVYPILHRIGSRIELFIERTRTHAIRLLRINRNRYLSALADVILPSRNRDGQERANPGGRGNPIEQIRQLGRDAHRNNQLILSGFRLAVGGIFAFISNFLSREIERITLSMQVLITSFTFQVINVLQSVMNLLLGIQGIVITFLMDLYSQLQVVMNRVTQFVFTISLGIANALLIFCRGAYTRVRNTVMNVIRNIIRIGTRIVSGILEAAGTLSPSVTRAEVPDAVFLNAINKPFPGVISRLMRFITRATLAFSTVLLVVLPLVQLNLLLLGSQFLTTATLALTALMLLPIVQVLINMVSAFIRPAVISGSVASTEYAPGTGLLVDYSVPLVKNDIMVTEGEKLIFGVEAKDTDKTRTRGSAWREIPGKGPYETRYRISGDADLLSEGSGTKEAVIPQLSTRNIYVFIHKKWNRKKIMITARLKDKAPPSEVSASGSLHDSDKLLTWTLVPRKNPPPAGLKRISGPGNNFTPAPAVYGYEGTPALPPRRPSYLNQTVLESFGTTQALFFTMADLSPAWKTANPTLDTPDKVAVYLYGTSNNGTFVFDRYDRIYDQHSGFGDTDPFLASAKSRASGIGYRIFQTYSSAGKAIGKAVIDRRYTASKGVEIKKDGP